MSNNVFTTSLLSLPSAHCAKSSRRKAVDEDWNDDPDYDLRPCSASSTIKNGQQSRLRSSPTESWYESWDESPPGSSKAQLSQLSKAPSPLNLPAPTIPPPRLSPSRTSPLPTPRFPVPESSSATHQQLVQFASPSVGYAELGAPLSNPKESRSRFPLVAEKIISNKSVTRHPSRSLLPNSIPLDSSEYFPLNRSSVSQPHSSLPRSDSSEQMPPPSLPIRPPRTQVQSRSASTEIVRISSIPFSPSQEAMEKKKGDSKRPDLWKRLSGAPSTSNKWGESRS